MKIDKKFKSTPTKELYSYTTVQLLPPAAQSCLFPRSGGAEFHTTAAQQSKPPLAHTAHSSDQNQTQTQPPHCFKTTKRSQLTPTHQKFSDPIKHPDPKKIKKGKKPFFLNALFHFSFISIWYSKTVSPDRQFVEFTYNNTLDSLSKIKANIQNRKFCTT